MKLDEYTISPTLAATMEAAFAPFVHRKIDGVPLSKWLSQQLIGDRKPLPENRVLAFQLAQKLENILALDGGLEGGKLLDALDGIIHGGGAPALLVHGLPKEGPVSPIIREAFRLRMFVDPAQPKTCQPRFIDKIKRTAPTGCSEGSYGELHQDDTNVVMLFGIDGGINPRRTAVLSLDDYFSMVANIASQKGAKISAADVAELASLPLWPVVASMGPAADTFYHLELNQRRLDEATRLGYVRTVPIWDRTRDYAPLVYPNPAYNAQVPGSAQYKVLLSPADHLQNRMKFDMAAVPPHLQPVAAVCVETMREVIRQGGAALSDGPVLLSGDLLVFNDSLVLHAGGGYIHEQLPLKERFGKLKLTPRQICVLDVETRPPETYGVRPGDAVAKPIVIGKGVASSIDPATIERF